MSDERIFTCDRCGAKKAKAPKLTRAEGWGYLLLTNEESVKMLDGDLCESCLPEFRRWWYRP